MNIRKLTFFIVLFSAVSFSAGLYFSRQHKLSTGNCIECHTHIMDSDKLSAKARGKTELIFFHSSHVRGKLHMSCTECHSKSPHQKRQRPKESACLSCHTGADASEPSNSCDLCHAKADQLNL